MQEKVFPFLVIISVFILIECEVNGTDPYKCPANAIQISSPSELQDIEDILYGYYCLTMDIDLTDLSFEPIGSINKPFTGTLNGNSKKISNLKIINSTQNEIALFSLIGREGIVKNLTIENPIIKGVNRVASLAGVHRGTIETVGIENASVTGTGTEIGGLVGNNEGSITNSYITGDIIGKKATLGGLAGTNTDSITNSYATGNVTVNGEGGLEGNRIGGLVGHNNAVITNSYAVIDITVNLTGTGIGTNIGGLIGQNINNANITNCYATGEVTGTVSTTLNIGGLIGGNYDNAAITNSYAIGNVTGTGTLNIGGLIGKNHNNDIIENSYFDTSSTGQANGIGDGGQIGVTGITIGNITNGGDEPFIGSDWDFVTIWEKQGTGQWPRLIKK